MPPHLHPRSAATSTLFAGTLLASFVVISIPHLFPCPRPTRQYLEGDSRLQADADDASKKSQVSPGGAKRTIEEEAAVLKMFQDEARRIEKEARECPVPKPSGWLGRKLGFEPAKSGVASKTDEA